MKLIIINLFICLTFVVDVSEWELVKEKDGIRVYVRKSESNPNKEVKIKGQIACSMSELVAALEDVEAQKDWVKSTIDARYISKQAPNHFLFYISTDFPYPVKDRDVVIEYNRVQDLATKVVNINYEGVHGKEKTFDKFVRIPQFKASYTLTPQANGLIDVDYYLSADIGGTIPKWIVNMAITKGPVDTIESLFDLIKSGHYKDVKLIGVVD